MNDRYQDDFNTGRTGDAGGLSQTGSGVGGVQPSHGTGTASPEYRDDLTAQDTAQGSDYEGHAGLNQATSDSGIGDTDETRSMISADKVQGTAVYDVGGEKLGTVDSLMIDKVQGHVEYVVMASGGFLGIGERYQPLPWDALAYDTDLGGYKVNQSLDHMRTAPNYSRDEVDAYDYDSRGEEIDDWYGTEATQSSTMPSSGIGQGGSRSLG